MNVTNSQLYLYQVVPATTPARLGTGTRLMGCVIYPASAITKLEFKNGATDTGDVLLTLQGGDDVSSPVVFDFTPFGGIVFSTAIFCKPVGTGAIVSCWFD